MEITENPDIEEPGTAVIVRTTGRTPTVFSEIAQYGDTSEALARSLGKQIRGFLAASAPIETHLADQIILPLFFAAGGSFLTKGSSEHLESCIKVLELFTGQKVKTEKDGKCLVVNEPKFKRQIKKNRNFPKLPRSEQNTMKPSENPMQPVKRILN